MPRDARFGRDSQFSSSAIARQVGVPDVRANDQVTVFEKIFYPIVVRLSVRQGPDQDLLGVSSEQVLATVALTTNLEIVSAEIRQRDRNDRDS